MNTNFNEIDLKSLVKMALDLHKGFEISIKEPTKFTLIENKYSKEEANDIFNKKLIKTVCDKVGLDYNEGKLDWFKFSQPTFNHAFFNLISEVINAVLPKILTNQFDMLTRVKNANWGDKMIIEVTSPDYFYVSKISNGTSNLRRQRLDRRAIELLPTMRGIKVYSSIFRILSGLEDWATYINKCASSLATAIKTDVYDAIYNSYSSLSATYGATGAFSGSTFNTMVEHVRAASGGLQPIAMGTRLSLQKILPATGVAGLTSMNMLDALNDQGYLGKYQGTNMFMIEQAHKPSTDTFAISDQFVIIAAMGANRIANLGFEGNTIITANNPNEMANMEVEYTIQQAWDTQVLSPVKYGIYRVTA